jgi:outer membrane protein assembly factor BamE
MRGLTPFSLIVTAFAAALSGCGAIELPSTPRMPSLIGWIKPYRTDIVQGNVVTREQSSQVRLGMNRAQVRDILGSPMITDVFHADRWDYIFMMDRPGVEVQRRAYVVHFKEDRLIGMDTTELPTEREFVAAISTVKPSGRTPVLELTDEQRKALPPPPKPVAEPVAASAPARSYPPLEAP